MIHESSFLLFVPVHLFISYSIVRQNQSIEPVKSVTLLLLIYLPASITLISIILYGRPTFEIAADICSHWEQLGALKQGSCVIADKNPSWALPGSFTALSWSITQAISLPLSLTVKTLATWLLLFFVLGFYTVRTGSMVIRESAQIPGENNFTSIPSARVISRHTNFKYFFLPLLVSLPLYILGWDFGRWFAVICTNYALIILSKEVLHAEGKLISLTRKKYIVNPDENTVESHKNIRFILGSLLLLAILIFIRLPHCCISSNVFNEMLRGLIE